MCVWGLYSIPNFISSVRKKSKIKILFVIMLYNDLLSTSASDITLSIGVIPKCLPWQTVKTQMECVISCMGESFQD